MAQTETVYPIQFSVEYPGRPLNRLSTALRLFWVIPIAIVLSAVAGGSSGSGTEDSLTHATVGAGGFLFFAPLLMILFRRKYPRWWFDWNVAVYKFALRVTTYFLLLRDEYPSTDDEQAVHLVVPYPDVERDLNRWLPLVKWLLAIPHCIVLIFLAIAVVVVVIVSWFAILFTGRYPRDLFDFVVGVMRWGIRVEMYALVLVTDRYPPFRLGL